MNKSYVIFTLLCMLGVIGCERISAQQAAENIRLNQIGFYPDGSKVAIVVGKSFEKFSVVSTELKDTVYSGQLSPPKLWPPSQEEVQIADFSELRTSGTFKLHIKGWGESYDFSIADSVYHNLASAVLKAFYFQRISMPLTERYAGKWKRATGHAQDADRVLVHASAASSARPQGTRISSPKGWYDAGDYNKYIVNSGITTYTILAIYEHFPEYAQALELDIPESGNNIPDVLEEALWNIRWMMTMQDPNDGGVYHKLTHANFCGFIMPHEATTDRYIVQKSTAAALDFAAVMAQASRIFATYENYFPGLSDSCRKAAIRAWDWASASPQQIYRQNELNEAFEPDIYTGAYGDQNIGDEFHWAAMELYITTQDRRFLSEFIPLSDIQIRVTEWRDVATLGLYSLFQHCRKAADLNMEGLQKRFLKWAQEIKSEINHSAYRVVMGIDSRDFVWGSNAVAANQGIAMIQTYRLTADPEYLTAAIANLDYLLGRNATGYSFVTGFGSKTPLNIHHRQSAADGIDEPIPGFLVGGPNPNQQDGDIGYPSKLPARSYIDVAESYASNEIAINWNAAMAYLVCAVEALMSPNGLPPNITE